MINKRQKTQIQKLKKHKNTKNHKNTQKQKQKQTKHVQIPKPEGGRKEKRETKKRNGLLWCPDTTGDHSFIRFSFFLSSSFWFWYLNVLGLFLFLRVFVVFCVFGFVFFVFYLSCFIVFYFLYLCIYPVFYICHLA